MFDKQSANKNTEFWQCKQKHQCKAHVHIAKQEFVKIISTHSHEPSIAKTAGDKIVTKV